MKQSGVAALLHVLGPPVEACIALSILLLASEILNFSTLDRLKFAGLYRLAPSVLGAMAILKPETVIRWHRAGFRSYWRSKSRHRGGRPTVPLEIRRLIREMSLASPVVGGAANPW
jgi:hypothetical protein